MTTPVKMKVYDYITMGEKDTLMSPLDSIKFHRKHMQIGSIAMDPHTGEVKAWVGGTNFKYFKYDHVNSRRQVGSTFKPLYTQLPLHYKEFLHVVSFKMFNIQFLPMIQIFTFPRLGHLEMLLKPFPEKI